MTSAHNVRPNHFHYQNQKFKNIYKSEQKNNFFEKFYQLSTKLFSQIANTKTRMFNQSFYPISIFLKIALLHERKHIILNKHLNVT